jgi:hypothetical protein
VQYQFPRTRHPLYLVLHPNHHLQGPHTSFLNLFYLPSGPLPPSLSPTLRFLCSCAFDSGSAAAHRPLPLAAYDGRSQPARRPAAGASLLSLLLLTRRRATGCRIERRGVDPWPAPSWSSRGEAWSASSSAPGSTGTVIHGAQRRSTPPASSQPARPSSDLLFGIGSSSPAVPWGWCGAAGGRAATEEGDAGATPRV